MPAVQETAMGRIVIVAYRPKPGKIEALHALAKQHVDFLRGEGLVTDRVPILMTADDGTVLEVFEWTSKAAMESAHGNAKVLELWNRYAEVCDYIPLAEVPEATHLFSGFAPL